MNCKHLRAEAENHKIYVSLPSNFSESDCISFVGCIRMEGLRWDEWSIPFRGCPIDMEGDLEAGELKFVLFKSESNKDDKEVIFPIVFSKNIFHNDLAEATFYLSRDYLNPIYAGFINLAEDGTLSVHGRSESLDLDSNAEFSTPYLEKLFLKK